MKDRLIDMGLWIVLHPGEAWWFAAKVWCVATIIAFVALVRRAKKDTQPPRAPGFKSRRVS